MNHRRWSLTSLFVCTAALFAAVFVSASGLLADSSTNEVIALPGAKPFDPNLASKIAARRAAIGTSARPSPKFANRLILETNEYLLQHAYNPVNWYPWGTEAFATAKRLGVPVFLSIGYSTCHWCHVMEEESFENVEIAKFLNEHFVAIKVDREARPDIDQFYMAAIETISGSGGWPLSVFLSSDRKPFFGGTYFPPDYFAQLLKQIAEKYAEDPTPMNNGGVQIMQLLKKELMPPGNGELPGDSIFRKVFDGYSNVFDSVNGGTRGAPKFMSNLPIRLLLQLGVRFNEPRAAEMASFTLRKIADGGIRDQLGGGFHRYSTDAEWTVPHFEMIMGDNALLARALLDEVLATKDQKSRTVLRELFEFVDREMTSPDGGFYTARDADSPDKSGQLKEGYYYTWTPEEIAEAVGKSDAPFIISYFGIQKEGPLEGRSVLRVSQELDQLAREKGMKPEEAQAALARGIEKLRAARRSRAAPEKDRKILTEDSSYMVSALATAGAALNEPKFVQRAERAANFILKKMKHDERLFHAFESGAPTVEGFVGDYAALINALLDLFEATGRSEWLEEAIALDRTAGKLFEDPERGGFFTIRADEEGLPIRSKFIADDVRPSGNSLAALYLARLGELTSDETYTKRAIKTVQASGPALFRDPFGYADLLRAAELLTGKLKTVIIVLPDSAPPARDALSSVAFETYTPDKVVIRGRERYLRENLLPLVSLLREKTAVNGHETAYVCVKKTCKLPTSKPEELERQLRE